MQDDVRPFGEAWRASNLAALDAEGPLWVALGDSLTQGIGASAYDRGWVGQLRDRLAAAQRPHRVVNLGVSGARALDVVERQLPVLETLRPDLVTLMIGANDVLRPRYGHDLVAAMTALAERIPAGSLVTTLPYPTPGATASNRAVRRIAAERGLVVVEMRDPRVATWRGRLAADHFHPNDAGYTALADVVGDALGL